uniref:GDNF/GAS1 domain-containing protein n=1 Tax=Periophthalmus magnuspinnatus TaxID=409849 RepID=A0A3B3ZUN6_9GOBI
SWDIVIYVLLDTLLRHFHFLCHFLVGSVTSSPSYRLLEYCAAEEAVSPLGSDARLECLEAQHALQYYRPLQVCKCQRGSRREEHCLKSLILATEIFSHMILNGVFLVSAYEEYDISPYEELKINLVRNIEMSQMASIMSGTAALTQFSHSHE